MASIRTRLAVTYGVTMVVLLVVFAVALAAARRARGYQELGKLAIVQGDNVLAVIRAGERLDTLTTKVVDSSLAEPRPVVRATTHMRDLLDPLGGYFLVLDWEERVIYRSRAMRVLPDSAQAILRRVAVGLDAGERAAVVELPHDTATHGRLLLVARRDPSIAREIKRVVVGVTTDITELPFGVIAGTGLMLTPLLILLAIVTAVFVARGTFRPLDEVVAELGAITDGRSLHRRLPADQRDDELARLSSTLNAMIARLETSFAGLRRFTADASHELKTPLTVLRANVERAMSSRTPTTERMVALEEALQEIARMTDLVDSLLTLARADEGRFDLHRERLRLEPLARDVFETAQILGENSGITVSLLAAEDAPVLGDPVRLRQLFLNLVTNAIKYTPRGGRVDLSLRRTSEIEAVFAVRDTGVGISAADLPHIFDRFWRADRARSRASERGGFGLGLSIAQWIAHAHGGTLSASSRLGRGSIFSVSLPVAAENAAADEPTMKRA